MKASSNNFKVSEHYETAHYLKKLIESFFVKSPDDWSDALMFTHTLSSILCTEGDKFDKLYKKVIDDEAKAQKEYIQAKRATQERPRDTDQQGTQEG